MSSTIAPDLRALVAERAENLCEYCLIHEFDTFYGCQVDHIISQKHDGPTHSSNLAYACAFCNRRKGSDLGSIRWESGELIRFYNPRVDAWHLHFTLGDALIVPLSPIGQVTERILHLNHVDRVIERRTLIGEGRYPSPAAYRLAHGLTA